MWRVTNSRRHPVEHHRDAHVEWHAGGKCSTNLEVAVEVLSVAPRWRFRSFASLSACPTTRALRGPQQDRGRCSAQLRRQALSAAYGPDRAPLRPGNERRRQMDGEMLIQGAPVDGLQAKWQNARSYPRQAIGGG